MMRAPILILSALLVGCNSASDSIDLPTSVSTDRSIGPPNTLPIEASNALRNGISFELLSLDPLQRDGKSDSETFHNWVVLGVTRIDNDSIRAELLDALDAGIAENDGIVAACFDPRHGIRIIHNGKRYEFVICFECFSARWYTDGGKNKGFRTTGTPQPVFDRVLDDAGIELAPPAE